MNPLFQIPEDFAALSDEELRSFIETSSATATKVSENAAEYVSEERDSKALIAEMTAGVAAIGEARAMLASREAEGEPETPEVEATDEIDVAALAELANRANAEEPADEETDEDEPEAETASADEPTTVATARVKIIPDLEGFAETVEKAVATAVSATLAASAEKAEEAKPVRLARPARSRRSVPEDAPKVAMVAAAENLGYSLGEELPDSVSIAKMLIERRRHFGMIPEGTHGEQIPIARAAWGHLYEDERRLTGDFESDAEKIEAVVASSGIRERFESRRSDDPTALVASGGLCAPVTNYYDLAMISVAERPVRASLPSFNADRGGIKFGRPAALTAIDDAVGIITEAEDAAGGASATKTCQIIDCPDFEEVDVATIYHCLQTGNLLGRTFPELLAQWTDLTLAAHARTAESALLDGIRAASTKVTASNADALGASAQIPSQVLAAAAGMRSRHRMDPEAVLRVQFPEWVLDLLVSDVYKSQFQRFDMTPEKFVGLLRDGNVEPSFYIDGATGRSQIIGAQGTGTLVSFPSTVEWYLYPEGSFLYIDGGTLELGLVRDSVLNSTNDYQLFGESFENVAFIGVESIAVTTTVDDRGATSAPVNVGAVSYA